MLTMLLVILSTTDYSATKAMLEKISDTVSELKKKPTTAFKERVCCFPEYILKYVCITLIGA